MSTPELIVRHQKNLLGNEEHYMLTLALAGTDTFGLSDTAQWSPSLLSEGRDPCKETALYRKLQSAALFLSRLTPPFPW